MFYPKEILTSNPIHTFLSHSFIAIEDLMKGERQLLGPSPKGRTNGEFLLFFTSHPSPFPHLHLFSNLVEKKQFYRKLTVCRLILAPRCHRVYGMPFWGQNRHIPKSGLCSPRERVLVAVHRILSLMCCASLCIKCWFSL